MDESAEESVFVDNTPEELKIIREFYLNENSNEAQEYFESELEAALEARTKLIVIEPKQFGQATARYIYIALLLPERTIIYLPFSAFGIICTSLYSISWSSDPASRYRVVCFDERKIDDDKELRKLRECLCCDNETPIILTKEEGNFSQWQKNLFQRSIAFLAAVLSSFKFYQLVKFASI